MKNIWNKFKQNRFTFARTGILAFVFFVFLIKNARASPAGDVVGSVISFAGGAMATVIGEIGVFFLDFVSYMLSIAQSLFQLALLYNLRFGNKLEIVQIGWAISRDVANMFFIVVLLIIAIATILRISSYTAKQLLPSLIFMAILINFSLTIGLVVVDASNILGLQFYNAITDNNTKTVSSLIMIGTGMQHVFDFKDPSAGTLENFARGVIQTKVESVTNQVPPKLIDSWNNGNQSAFAITAWGNAVFMSVLVFVFFVATIILLVRVAVIATLLMLAPLAFLFYILPDTRTHWNKWWSTLMQHCFFLPAFLFLLYFAIVFIIKVGMANSGPGNFVDSPGLIFAYILAIILLIQALVLGRSMGVMGASTAISWAQSGKKIATGFVAGQTIGRASGRLLSAPGVQKFIENQRPWIGRRLQGYLEKGAATGGRQKSADATAAFVSRLSPEDQAKKWAQMSFAEKQALLRKLGPEQRNKLLSNLTGEQRVLADRILGTSLAADQKADLDASQYQRMQGSEDQKREAYAGLSRGAKERVLRTMNQEERADFVKKLRDSKNPNLVAAANLSEDILKKDFTPNEYTAYKVEQFKNETAARQLARFNDPTDAALDPKTRSMILFGMKDDEREAFLGKLTDRRAAEKIMQDYFPPEKLLEMEAARVNAIKDPAVQRAEFLALKNTKSQEAILRKKTDQQRALFIAGFAKTTDKQDAETLLQNMLTPSEYAKYEAQKFLLGSQQDQATTFGAKDLLGNDLLSDFAREEILRQKKDPNAQALFVENLSPDSKAAALGVIKNSFSPDELAAFNAAAWNLLSPEQQAASFAISQEATQEKILRSLTGERRAGFLADLNNVPSQRAMADKIIKNNFSIDERAAIYAEEWKLKLDTDASKDKMNFFAAANGDDLVQEKILTGFKDADEMERFVSGLEKSKDASHQSAAANARRLLNSARFTATQRSEFKKARTKQAVTLADNANLLSGYFMLEPDAKIRGEIFEAMNDRQQIDMIEDAARKGPASMEAFSGAVLKMKPHLREAFVTKTLSHASNEAIESYFAQKDAEIQANAFDSQKQDELRGEKKRAFKGLHGDAKANLWAKAFETDSKTPNDTRERDKFKSLMEGSNPTELDSYRTALGRVLGDKIVKSPNDAASMYGDMDEKAKQLYLKSSGGRTLVSKLYESAPAGSDIPEMIRNDFIAAGQNNSKEFGKMKGRREKVTTERTYNIAKGISEAAEAQIIQQQGVANMAQGISEAAAIQGLSNVSVGISEAARAQEKTTEVQRVAQGISDAAREASAPIVVTAVPQGAPAPVPSRTAPSAGGPARPTAPAAAPAPATRGGGGGGGGGGRKNLNQATVNEALAESGGSGQSATLPPNIEKALGQPPTSAAKAFITLPPADQQLAMQRRSKDIIGIIDAAPTDSLPNIINAVQQSDPAKRFRKGAGTQGKLNALNTMSLNDKLVAFEAIASSNDPREIKDLRKTIASMPPKQQEEFAELVVAQGSKSSVKKYLQEAAEEKVVAQTTGMKGDVERINKEERIVATALKKPIEVTQTPEGIPPPAPPSPKGPSAPPTPSSSLPPPPPAPSAPKVVDSIRPANVPASSADQEATPTKFVESSAAAPQEVGVQATENVAGSNEAKLDSELKELISMESELASPIIDETGLERMLQKINGKLLLLESLKRSQEETAGDATKIEKLAIVIRRFKALKAKAEAKMKELKK